MKHYDSMQKKKLSASQICFLGSGKTFLKGKVDLNSYMWGEPLDDLIALDFNEFQVGCPFKKELIPKISNSIYKQLVQNLEKKENLHIEKSNVIIFVSTVCKIDDIIFFQVYQIRTEEVCQTKQYWEKELLLFPGQCCKNSLVKGLNKDSILSKQVSTEEDLRKDFEKLKFFLDQKLNSAELPQTSSLKTTCPFDPRIETEESFSANTNCHYKENHVWCKSLLNFHFLNKDNPKAMQSFQDSSFNIAISPTPTLGSMPETLRFCYGGGPEISCKSLYDRLIFEKSADGQIVEQNFQNFLSDSLQSCLVFQERIEKKSESEIKEHRVLFMSVYI